MRYAMISILVSSCAASQLQPASEPASMPMHGYELISEGEPAHADGLFITIPHAREMLKQQRLRELDLQEQIVEAETARDQEAKTLKGEEWCAKWCLPLGLGLGIIGGGAFGIWAAQRK